MKIYREEHPNPQFKRANWENLNGEWDFGFKKAERAFRFSSDEKRAVEIHGAAEYPYKINVPFCIESKLSGIGYRDFVNMVWYRKKVNIRKGNNSVFLHKICRQAQRRLHIVCIGYNRLCDGR